MSSAISLYITTAKTFFQLSKEEEAERRRKEEEDEGDEGEEDEEQQEERRRRKHGKSLDCVRLLFYLRNSLICTVCGKLLVEPMSSTVASCQHYSCKECLDKKGLPPGVTGGVRKPSCSLCKDASKFVVNCIIQQVLVVYKQLCDFILHHNQSLLYSQLDYQHIQSEASSSASLSLMQLIQEGASYQEKKEEAREVKRVKREEIKIESESEDDKVEQVQQTIVPPVPETPVQRFLVKKSETQRKKGPLFGCRCGLATQNPGKLTCCGQRCPCYVQQKSCDSCKCRGCRNPHKVKEKREEAGVSLFAPLFVNKEEEPPTTSFIFITN